MPAERRKAPRRDDDAERALADSFEHEVASWTAWVVKRRALLFVIGSVIGSVFTLVATAFAMRYTDPAKEVKAVRTSVDSIRFRVDSNVIPRLTRVEQGIVDGREDRARINRKTDWLVYMSCRAFIDSHPKEFRPDICIEGKPK